MLKVTIGTAPVNWNNEDVPDYRPWTPLEDMLDQMAAAGYAGTEVSAAFPPDPARIKRDLAARGLMPASTFCAVNLREDDDERRAVELARAEERAAYVAALGSDVLLVADNGDERRRALAGHVGLGDALDDGAWQRLIGACDELAARCLRHGVRVAVHNHVGTYIETEAELRRLLDGASADRVGLCYDVGHMLYAGGDVDDVLRLVDEYGPRLRYLHLKDVDMDVLARCHRDGLGFHDALRQGVFTEFGTGGMDFARLFAALDRLDYQGWLIVEQDTTRRTPLQSAMHNRSYLRDRFGL